MYVYVPQADAVLFQQTQVGYAAVGHSPEMLSCVGICGLWTTRRTATGYHHRSV